MERVSFGPLVRYCVSPFGGIKGIARYSPVEVESAKVDTVWDLCILCINKFLVYLELYFVKLQSC